MNNAMRGLFTGGWDGDPSSAAGRASVFVFIFWRCRRRARVRAGIGGRAFVVEERIVKRRLADSVLLGGPVAEVVQLAAFAAERKLGVGGRIRGFFADWAAMFHEAQNTAN